VTTYKPCESCGRLTTYGRNCGSCEDEATIHALRAEVLDLKARLRAVRLAMRDPDVIDPVADIERATDLRRKNWRRP